MPLNASTIPTEPAYHGDQRSRLPVRGSGGVGGITAGGCGGGNVGSSGIGYGAGGGGGSDCSASGGSGNAGAVIVYY